VRGQRIHLHEPANCYGGLGANDMTLIFLVFLGGALTIVSPCILPVLPFVFARAEQPFLRNGLPMLVGMALTFAGVATLAAVGGAWAVNLNQYGRVAALIVLTVLALTLLSDRLADWIAQPFVAAGNRLTQSSQDASDSGIPRSMLLGIATGLLWAPCAGPILGLVLTGAAIGGASAHTTLLLLAYAVGAAVSLAFALLAGRKLFAALKRSLGTAVWIRRGLGVAVLSGVAVIASGVDTGALTQLSLTHTDRLEQSLLSRINMPIITTGATARPAPGAPGDEGDAPSFDGATAWLNSPALTTGELRGKVVLVDFWTYSCINCLRSLPYVKSWYEKYKKYGLVVIGVHAPEFAFEKDIGNVRHAVGDLRIDYPVALDNDYAIWKGFHNQFWPAHYFVDARGRVRGHHFGEGDYNGSEQLIRELLLAAGANNLPPAGMDAASLRGVEVSADREHERSPETYIGFERAQHFSSSSDIVRDAPGAYEVPSQLSLNQWALSGMWTVTGENATVDKAGGAIAFRFYARDLHLVLGPGNSGRPLRFHVLLDGAAPADNHGSDVEADGKGIVSEQRLYQLIRQSGDVSEHTFTIVFDDKDVTAYAFTFG
jgi:cytochrome c biogenesis protein CcdA/thiol-disulfide isomerase/thioredoxin